MATVFKSVTVDALKCSTLPHFFDSSSGPPVSSSRGIKLCKLILLNVILALVRPHLCRTQEGPAYTWLFSFHTFRRSDVRLLRSNFGLYTFIKGQRDKGTKGQRDKGTKGKRDKGTKGQRDLGTWELGNLGTWELGNLGTWELGNLGN